MLFIGGKPYQANAVNYNGSSDYLSMAGALSGAVDGPQATISVWLKPTTDGTIIFTVGLSEFICMQSSSVAHKYSATGAKTGPTTIANVVANSAITVPAAAWHHFMYAWDMGAGPVGKAFLDGVDVSSTAFGTGNMHWSQAGVAIAALTSGSGKYSGDMAELWVDQTYVDPTTNITKFRNATTGKPVKLGVNGELPTGSSPLIYLPNAAASVGTNLGTGGNFTINGSPSVASSAP